MLLRPHLLVLTCLVFALGGCASAPKDDPALPPPVPENTAILQAQIDLDNARNMQAEWNVRLNASDADTQSLTQILELARQAQEAGDTDLATELAQKVIRFARLGVQQATEQQNAGPYYPQ